MLIEMKLDYNILSQYAGCIASARYQTWMTDTIISGEIFEMGGNVYIRHDDYFSDHNNFTLLPNDKYMLYLAGGLKVSNEDVIRLKVNILDLLPEEYDYCYVSNKSYQDAYDKKRMRKFIHQMPDEHKKPFHCVRRRDEDSYRKGGKYDTKGWKYAVRILDGYKMTTTCID